MAYIPQDNKKSKGKGEYWISLTNSHDFADRFNREFNMCIVEESLSNCQFTCRKQFIIIQNHFRYLCDQIVDTNLLFFALEYYVFILLMRLKAKEICSLRHDCSVVLFGPDLPFQCS